MTKNTTIQPELLDELLKAYPRPTQDDLFGPDGLMKQLSKALMERCLEAEISTHLGYEKRTRKAEDITNLRNGSSRKTLKSEYMDIPTRPNNWLPYKGSIFSEPALEIGHNCPLQTHHSVNHLRLDRWPGFVIELTEAWTSNRPGKRMIWAGMLWAARVSPPEQ